MAGNETTNGLSRFSMHAFDDSSSAMIDGLREEQTEHPDFALTEGEDLGQLDPETAARRHLDQALASSAVPAFSAPAVRVGVSELKSLGTETVALTGTRVVKFRQTIDKIPLYGSLITVELDEDNSLVGIDSALGVPTDVSPVASISPADAVAAVAALPGYVRDLSGSVPRLHYYFEARYATWRLVYILEDVPVEVDPATQTKADAASRLEPPRAMDYVVEAHTGRVVAELPRTPSLGAVEQTATDELGHPRTFLADDDGRGLVLHDPVHNVATFDFGFRDPSVESARLPGRALRNPPTWDSAAISAHANAVAVSDFLRNELRRNNIDDRGGAMISTINCVVAAKSPGPKQWHNAYWTPAGGQMVYGQALDGGVLRSLSVNLDIVAHEIFHGVTDRTARLEYAVQSGAMNESYSDIFGVLVSNLGRRDPRKPSWDWEVGEGVLPGGLPLRDLSDPTRFGQPDHLRDFVVRPNTQAGDWGGVHKNSGIHNKAAFNLLTAETAAGKLALTPREVAAVFYLALTQRLSRTSQFLDSRVGVVVSARTLFRARPPAERARKIAAIEASFDAVGIR